MIVVIGALLPSAGFTQNGLGLIPPLSVEDSADLSGEWIFLETVLQLSQTGKEVTGKILEVTKFLEKLGYRPGDIILRGELRGKTIYTNWLIPTPDTVRQQCPNHWPRWKTLEIPLSENLQGMLVSFHYQTFKRNGPNEFLCEEDTNTNLPLFLMLGKKPAPKTVKQLGTEVLLRLEVDSPGLIAEPGKPVGVSIHLVDGKGNAVKADQEITLNLKSTLGKITPSTFTISKGNSSRKGTFHPREPGMAIIFASINNYTTQTTLPVIKSGKERGKASKPVMADLILDQPGGPVGFPLEVKAVLRDKDGLPTLTEEPQTLTFRLFPIVLTERQAGPQQEGTAGGTPPGIEASQNTMAVNTRTVNNGEVLKLDFSLGSWELKAVVEEGWSGFAFKVAWDEARIIDIQVGGAKLSGSRDTLVGAERGEPENLYIRVNDNPLKANGTDQSKVAVILVGPSATDKNKSVPKCGSVQEYEIILESTLGGIITPPFAKMTTKDCNTRTRDKILLTASKTPGTATVTAVSPSPVKLVGTKQVLFTLMPPAFYQFLLALLGGGLGGFLQRYRSFSQEDVPRPFIELFNFALIVSAIIGLTLYLATYYGSFKLHFAFYTHGVFAAFIGLVGGFVGFPVLDKIAEKFGFKTAPQEKDQNNPS